MQYSTRTHPKEVGHMVAEGAVVSVLLDGHDLDCVVAQGSNPGQHGCPEIQVVVHFWLLTATPQSHGLSETNPDIFPWFQILPLTLTHTSVASDTATVTFMLSQDTTLIYFHGFRHSHSHSHILPSPQAQPQPQSLSCSPMTRRDNFLVCSHVRRHMHIHPTGHIIKYAYVLAKL